MAIDEARAPSTAPVTRAPQHPARRALPSNDLFALLVEAVVDYAIFLVSPEGRVVSWNRGAERIKGYTADEIIGQPISVFYPAEDARAGLPERNLRAAERAGHHMEQAWRVRKDGTRFWADIVLTPLRDREGNLAGFAKVTRDLTERRAAEERERQLAVEREARAAAEQALRSRDRFLSIASHELKTPVASLQVAVDALLIQQERGSLDGDRLASLLGRVDRATARMRSLLDELVNVSRLANESAPLDLGRVDLREVVEEVVERFSGIAQPERIRTQLEPVAIQGDADRLDQVVSNLLDNALKYSPADTPVILRLRPVDGGAELEVADQGRGIRMEEARLFEPFGRGSNVTDLHGMGLGLFISQRIVLRHGGQISAVSDGDGTGSTFRVFLPDQPPAPGG